MKKLYILIAILLFSTIGYAQNKESNIRKGETFRDLTFNASDTINEGETYWIEITNKQSFPQMQDVYLAGDAVSGSGDVVITVYGKKFSASSYSSIGTSTWNSTLALDETISVTTANRYRFLKVEFVSDGTAKQVLITDVKIKTWMTGGDLSTASLSLSSNLIVGGTVTVAGESTFNDHVNLGASADLIGSATSDIILNATAFVAEGATGDVSVGNDLDVVADLTAGTITSDAAITATSGMDLGTSQSLVGTTAITIGSGGVTTAITSSDWAIDATGVATGMGDITSNGLITSDKLRFENAVSTDVSALPAYFSLTLSDQFGNAATPAFGMTVYSKLLGANLLAGDAYEAAVTGLYGITGTNASAYPKTAVLGWIMDNTTTADAAFIALIDGDTQITQAGAAYGVRYFNSTPASEFGYGLDLYSAAIGGYNAVTYANADIRLVNEATIDNSTSGVINMDVSFVRSATYNFADATAVAGTKNAITIDFSPDLPTLVTGCMITYVSEFLNDAATTLTVDGGTTKNIYDGNDVSALSGGEIVNNTVVIVVYDGTQWLLVSRSGV